MNITANDLLGTSGVQARSAAAKIDKVRAYEAGTRPMDTLDEAIDELTNALAEAVLARGGVVRRNPTWDSAHSDTLLDAMRHNINHSLENFRS
jgi:hypothetical protein